jgi:hypothetical protein
MPIGGYSLLSEDAGRRHAPREPAPKPNLAFRSPIS